VPAMGGTHRANCTCVPGTDADVGDDEAGVARARFVKEAMSRQEIVVPPSALSGFYLDTFRHAHPDPNPSPRPCPSPSPSPGLERCPALGHRSGALTLSLALGLAQALTRTLALPRTL